MALGPQIILSTTAAQEAGQVSSDDLRLCDRYDTIILAKAATAVDKRLCYVISTATYYECVVNGVAYTPDDTSVLQIGAGNARWVGRAGQYVYVQTAQNAIQNIKLSESLAGELFVPFAYTNIESATSHQLNSAAKKISVGFVAKSDFLFNSSSFYKNAVGAAGDNEISLHADGLAYEPNGAFNGADPLALAMVANNSPAPFVATLVDGTGTNAEAGAGYEAHKAFNGSTAANDGTRSNAAPTALAPIILSLDTGTGIRPNKLRIYSVNNADANVRAYVKAFTAWGSNLATPDEENDAHYTQLTGFTATAETDPGAGVFRDYNIINAENYRHVRIKATDRNGANAYVAFGEVKIFGASLRSAPGTRLDDPNAFGNFDGTGAAAWGRKAFDNTYQGQRGKKYWITLNGADGVDVSYALNRVTGTNGTEFPDHSECLFSTDTGTTWSQAVISGAKAMLCAVLNSTTNHVPKLYYGRTRGMYDYLPNGGGLIEIPAAGISAECDALTASVDNFSNTKYSLYLNNNAGTLALTAVTTERTMGDEGIEVKTGAAAYRFVGIAYMVNRISTFQGPIDVGDARLLVNTGKGARSLRKRCPYVGTTNYVIPADLNYYRFGDSDDYKMLVATLQSNVSARAVAEISAGLADVVIGIDGVVNPIWNFRGLAGSSVNARIAASLSEGLHTLNPYHKYINSATTIYFYLMTSPNTIQSSAEGTVNDD